MSKQNTPNIIPQPRALFNNPSFEQSIGSFVSKKSIDLDNHDCNNHGLTQTETKCDEGTHSSIFKESIVNRSIMNYLTQTPEDKVESSPVDIPELTLCASELKPTDSKDIPELTSNESSSTQKEPINSCCGGFLGHTVLCQAKEPVVQEQLNIDDDKWSKVKFGPPAVSPNSSTQKEPINRCCGGFVGHKVLCPEKKKKPTIKKCDIYMDEKWMDSCLRKQVKKYVLSYLRVIEFYNNMIVVKKGYNNYFVYRQYEFMGFKLHRHIHTIRLHNYTE